MGYGRDKGGISDRGFEVLTAARTIGVRDNGKVFFLNSATEFAVTLPAVADAYQEKFPDYRFTNHHKTGLTGRLSVQPNSRHEHLIDAMADKDVVGVYFPCLSEYSIPAALQRIATLPEHLLLAGGFDTCAALVATPGLLMRTDGYPPLLWLSALASEKESVGYHFEAYGYNLTFNRRPHLGHAAEYWSSGISVLESC